MKEKNNTEDILGRSSLKENPFGVPAGYFAAMQEEVMQKISSGNAMEQEEEPQAAPATFITYFKPALSLAAVFAIVFGMGWSVMKVTEIFAPEVPLAQTEDTPLTEEEEIISILNISVEDIYMAGATDTEEDAPASTAISEEMIEQYLIDSGYPLTALATLE
jgi:hypothetical protein